LHITIHNIMQIESLELDLTAPLNVIAGPNEAGKSSIRDALLWGFTGEARGLKTHKDQAALIREGAKSGEVTISLDGQHAFTRRKTAKTNAQVLGEIPDIGLSPAILFDPYVYLAQSEDQRRELLFKVIPGLNPTEENVFKRLGRWPTVETLFALGPVPEQEPPGTVEREYANWLIIKTIAKMATSHGFPGAEKEAVAKRQEAKRVRGALEGTVTEPQKTLTLDGKEYSIPTLNFQAIEATLKELQKEKDGLLRQKGAGEAKAKRIAKIQGQLDGIGTPDTPNPDEITKLREELRLTKKAWEINARETIQAAVKNQTFPATCPVITLEQITCPKAGQMVGAEPPAPGVLKALTQNRQGLIKKSDEITAALFTAHQKVETYQAAVEKKKNLEEELTRLQAEPDAGADLDTEIAAREERILKGRVFQENIKKYKGDLSRFQDTQAKIAIAVQEIAIYDAIAKALAPDGIPSQMIAEALNGINGLLEEAAQYLFPGRYLHLTGELQIVLQNSPYVTLSKSAKYRVGIAFQYALAKLTGARILLIDEADILDASHLSQLIDFLVAHLGDFDQIMVFMTSETPILPKIEEFHSWWLEDGAIKRVA
jgi:DNA repair exonuclease SbcCD ATPase subunit